MKKLLAFLALLLLPALGEAQSTFYSPPLGFTLGSSGYTVPSPLLLPDGTAAAPALAFSNNTDGGIYNNSNVTILSNAGWAQLRINNGTSIAIDANTSLGWTAGAIGTAGDVLLWRDGAANTLAQRNSTNANTFSVYSTYTDASNYVRTDIGRSAYFGAGQGIVVDGLGTGANPTFTIGTRGTGGISFAPGGATMLQITSQGIVTSSQTQPGALTSATMTVENYGMLRTHVFSALWSNAQVVALGAVTSGDITVATLPAKTQLLDAAVVITGQGVFAPGAYTVQCGDTGTFNNYILASDAKAAVNTVYGDAVGERGTSIDVEHYYLPSYTATTTVTCRFITVGGNLSAVTGSTGKVILTTRLLP